MVDYKKTKSNLYDEVSSSFNFLRSWFHGSRNRKVAKYVDDYYSRDKIIVDLGCGNVLWNEKNIPATGVDVNEGSLDFSLSKKRLSNKIVASTYNTTLPDNFADIIIITEVLEHLDDLNRQMKEIYRILKPGGVVISSVPYDTNLSLWKPLFAIQCFYRGYILGEEYYKEKCGHINNFSKKTIAKLFAENNFKIEEQYNHYFFTIFTIVKK